MLFRLLRPNMVRASSFRPIRPFRYLRNFKRWNSGSSAAGSGAPNGANGTNGAKKTGLRALMAEYGYSGLAVYLALSMVDLPLCFLLVHSMGEEKIKEFQDKAKEFVGWKSKDDFQKGETGDASTDSSKDASTDSSNDASKDIAATTDSAVSDPAPSDASVPEKKSGIKSDTFWTEFALAYAIHKSLIVIRLPITAAITPAIVKQLRSMGFDVGNVGRATVKEIGKKGMKTFTKDGVKSIGKDIKFDPTASNPKFGKHPSKGQRWFF